MEMNPFLCCDSYKVGHHLMYPTGTTLVYSNFTPRSNKHAPKGCDKVVSFGQQMVMQEIKEMFDANFFRRPSSVVLKEIKEEYSTHLGTDYDVSHIYELWKLGYLPIKVKAIEEGTIVPIGTPILTIVNTLPQFFWLTNFLETIISNLLWKPVTSATIAYQYRKGLDAWANLTDTDNKGFVDFQAHDFSMRGLDSVYATMSSGLGHATSFLGSDSLPVIHAARKYYDETQPVVHSVNATEHSVMCAGGDDSELHTFRHLMRQFPTGALSIVSDTWDLWKVLTEILPALKDEIMARDGKVIIRPDSGDPADIICGSKLREFESVEQSKRFFDDLLCSNQIHGEPEFEIDENLMVKVGEGIFILTASVDWNRYDKQYYHIESITIDAVMVESKPSYKGVVELLWDLFGGTINDQGFKVLDPHIGAIYGDSINLERQHDICTRLAAKGFATTNVVFGIGSFTYQFNTRDTFGFAMKATYVEAMENIDGRNNDGSFQAFGKEIFKDPITDDGTKKSARGLIRVNEDMTLTDRVSWLEEGKGELKIIFLDGVPVNRKTLSQIREKLKSNG